MATAPPSRPTPGRPRCRASTSPPSSRRRSTLADASRGASSPRSRGAWTTRSGGPTRCCRSSARPGSSASRSPSPRAARASTSSRARSCSRAIARWNPAVALSWLAHENLCLNNILRNGDADQKQRYLPGLADGTKVGALALTEPGAGSDALGSMATVARRDGDDYLLTGRKIYITNGPIADVILVYAKTAPERGREGDLGLPRREVDARASRWRRSS